MAKILQDMVKVKRAGGFKEKNVEPKVQKDIYQNKQNVKSEKEKKEFRDSYFNKKFTSVYDNFDDKKDKGGQKYGLWFVALISIVVLFFAVSFLFSSAQITINPKTKDVFLNKNFSASKSLKDDYLLYNSVIIPGEESKTVKAGEEKDYVQPATGSVLLYNSFSTSSQDLSIDTRLEGSNGKIYKTKSKVTIPGMTKSGTPGKISVDIYASEPGEEYNSSPLDFKILGFKGTSKYSKFYGRSVGEIAGGLKGKARQLSDEEKEKAINSLKDTLLEKLFKKAKDQTPEDFVFFKNANFLNIEEQKIGATSKDGDVTITIKGTFYGLLFNKEEISKKITDSVLNDEEKGNDIYISNISNLDFSVENKDILLFTEATEMNFKLKGDMKIVWNVDSSQIILDVLGKSKKQFSQILSEYTNIESADLVVKPIWKRSFPEKTKDIKVKINYPE
ncbi:MAG TPA: hypothetical protein PKZ36_02040 [Candidatus Paceibacterota bacterium]|nr:hypothetical protein [Candidatus Paceibacterota bacterium]HPT18168.1 hypothetical protein [Candidatus Paceibacterota bacterium]